MPIHSDENGGILRQSLGQVVGWYWHFMGGVWIVLFMLLGFLEVTPSWHAAASDISRI